MLRSIDTTTKSGKNFKSLLLEEIKNLESGVSQKNKKKFNILKKIKEVIFKK